MAALTTTALAALTAASSITGALGQRRQGAAAEAQGNYEASIYGVDADLAEQQAADAIARGHEAELRARTATRQMIGSQRAGFTAAGVDANVGSAEDLQADTRAI